MNLIEAIKQNNQAEFFRILNLKTDTFRKNVIDEIDREYRANALHWTAALGHVHFIEPLLKAGADVNHRDKRGRTPIFIAAKNGHSGVI